MDFSLTQEQQALQDSVRRFCEREYGFEQRRATLRGETGWSRRNWGMFAELGWLGAGMSEEDGGFGGGPIETAIILEQLARAVVVEPFVTSAVIATQAIIGQATSEQRGALLSRMVAGEITAALAHQEPEQRGADENIATSAAARDGGYLLSGRKHLVLGAPHADILLVSARTFGGTRDREGISLFQVDPTAAGVQRRDYHIVDGRRASDILLDNVEIEADALIGDEGTALGAIERAIDHGIIGLCAEALGAMDAALWQTRDYLRARSQFGVTLNTHQALQHRMADMLIETELARSMLYRGLASLSDADSAARRLVVSAAKVQIGEAGYFVGSQAIQLHGGIGVTEDYIIGHYFKRLTMVRGLFGSTDTHLHRFATLSRSAEAA